MSKRNDTHIQVLLPEIKAMPAEGKTQREIAEYYGFKDKQVVKSYSSVRGERSASRKPGFFHGRKAGRGKAMLPEIL